MWGGGEEKHLMERKQFRLDVDSQDCIRKQQTQISDPPQPLDKLEKSFHVVRGGGRGLKRLNVEKQGSEAEWDGK